MTDLIHWFPGVGYRPAVWTPPHRADDVDPPRLVPSPDADEPMIAKMPPMDPWDHMPAAGYAWGTWIPAADTAAPQVTAASLAGQTPGPIAAPWHPATPPLPWWPGHEYPCHCITPGGPELPPIAPVPVSASGLMLVTAIVALVVLRGRSRETA